jgi:hypothetical protein
LKKKLEKLTGKRIELYDNEELYSKVEIDKGKLELITRKSFQAILMRQAVKEVYLAQVKSLLRKLRIGTTEKQVNEYMVEHKKELLALYDNFVLEKDLTIPRL